MSRSFSPTQIKVGDIIRLSETGWANEPPHARFVVTGKMRGLAGYRFVLSKIAGETYRYSWDFKDRYGWTAKELSAHHAQVFRNDKLVGNIVTKYW